MKMTNIAKYLFPEDSSKMILNLFFHPVEFTTVRMPIKLDFQSIRMIHLSYDTFKGVPIQTKTSFELFCFFTRRIKFSRVALF